MKKLKCNNGDKFGYWTIIDNTEIIKSGHVYVLCQCKCGKEQTICLSDLKNNRTTGCKSCKAQERSKKINIGDKYKGWTVINGPNVYNSTVMWEVQCDCGNKRWIQGNELLNPNKCFKCRSCAAKERGNNQAISNGKVGDLTLSRYTKIQNSASKRHIEFDISIEYLWNLFKLQKQICAITGDHISSIDDASLDRIDSNQGYIEGNVQWTTYQANVSKHIMSMTELYKFCEKILNYANQQPSTPLTKCEGSETSDWNS